MFTFSMNCIKVDTFHYLIGKKLYLNVLVEDKYLFSINF